MEFPRHLLVSAGKPVVAVATNRRPELYSKGMEFAKITFSRKLRIFAFGKPACSHPPNPCFEPTFFVGSNPRTN